MKKSSTVNRESEVFMEQRADSLLDKGSQIKKSMHYLHWLQGSKLDREPRVSNEENFYSSNLVGFFSKPGSRVSIEGVRGPQ